MNVVQKFQTKTERQRQEIVDVFKDPQVIAMWEKEEILPTARKMLIANKAWEYCNRGRKVQVKKSYFMWALERSNLIFTHAKDSFVLCIKKRQQGNTSLLIDIICVDEGKQGGKTMIEAIERYCRARKIPRLRLYSLSHVIPYYRKQNFVLSHHRYTEDPEVKSMANKFKGIHYSTRDQVLRDTKYVKFLKYLLDHDYGKICYLNIDWTTLQVGRHDIEGYAMLKKINLKRTQRSRK